MGWQWYSGNLGYILMSKVIYNNCYGGFGLSVAGYLYYCVLINKEPDIQRDCYHGTWGAKDIARHDLYLIKVVEELGINSYGENSKLCISEGEGCYKIKKYDGKENVIWNDEWNIPY